jgi:hypothetical protein
MCISVHTLSPELVSEGNVAPLRARRSSIGALTTMCVVLAGLLFAWTIGTREAHAVAAPPGPAQILARRTKASAMHLASHPRVSRTCCSAAALRGSSAIPIPTRANVSVLPP